MAKIDTYRLWRLRFADWRFRWTDLPRRPWLLALLMAGDLVELGLSIALGAASPPPPARFHAAYPTIDVPYVPPQINTTAAFLGIVLGLWMGAMLVAEMVVMIRRFQIVRYRAGAQRRRAG